MSSCECDMRHLAGPPERTEKSYEIQMMTGVAEKARMFPGAFVIQIDREWWAGLTVPERAAVLAHEMAHDENPTACEVCTDARAGARMRHEGISRAQAVSAISRLVKARRRTGDFDASAVGDGWDAADEWIRTSAEQTPVGALWAYTGNLDETVADVAARGLIDAGVVDPIPRAEDDGGQSFEVDDGGQSIGAPAAPSTPPRSSGPRTPATPSPTAPAAGGSNAMLMIGIAIVIVAVVMMSKKA